MIPIPDCIDCAGTGHEPNGYDDGRVVWADCTTCQAEHLRRAASELADALRACLAVMPVNWREDGEIAAARRLALMAIAKSEGRPIPVAPDHGWTTDDYAREDREFEARMERAEERAERKRARADDADGSDP